jgi:hypothetical protein
MNSGAQMRAWEGRRPMAGKTDFTAEEWKTLLESVMMAGIAVTAADPSGLWGTLKESMARRAHGRRRQARCQ